MIGSLAALALGAAFAATFSRWPLWWLAVLTLAGLFALMQRAYEREERARAVASRAFAFGMGWFGIGLAWLYTSMHDFGGMPAPLAAAAVVLFAAYLSLFPALAGWLAWRVSGGRGPWSSALAVAAAWALGELARGHLFTGFPWLAVGYSQIDGPLAGIAPLAGVYAVGAAAVAASTLLGVGALQRRAAPLVAAAALLGAAGLLPRGGWTRPEGPPLTVRLVQGNVPQEMKFRADRVAAAMNAYADAVEAATETLVILPETAWTIPWSATPQAVAQRILEHVRRGHTVAIGMPLPVGGPHTPGEPVPFANSVLALTPAAAADPRVGAQRYDKRHLVPFGEFVPLGFRWFVRLMDIPLGDFARGAPVQPPLEVGGQRIAFNVCYEDLFGEEIARALHGSRGATILANVSNIAWFGNSHALPQHLQIARMRSLETGRPMLRATNTGVTAAIDDTGRVVAQLPPYTKDSLSVTVQGMAGLTPFAHAGNGPVAGAAAVALLGLAWAGRWKSHARSERRATQTR